MRSRWPQYLLLACSLPLVLPAGWCCLLPLRAATPDAPPKARPCCCHCTAPEKTAPACPRPLPIGSGKCPCADRHTTAPDNPQSLACDLSLPAPVVVAALTPACARARDAVGFDLPPPTDLVIALLHLLI